MDAGIADHRPQRAAKQGRVRQHRAGQIERIGDGAERRKDRPDPLTGRFVEFGYSESGLRQAVDREDAGAA